jgi:hypothetical protein
MNNEELFNMIGRLYVDIYNTQKYLEILQKQIQEKDQEIKDLKKINSQDE